MTMREYVRGLRILIQMGELVTRYELRLAMRRALYNPITREMKVWTKYQNQELQLSVLPTSSVMTQRKQKNGLEFWLGYLGFHT